MRNLIFTLLTIYGFAINAHSQTTFFKLFQGGGQTYNTRLTKTKDGGYIQLSVISTPRDTLQKHQLVLIKYKEDLTVEWNRGYEDSLGWFGGDGAYNVGESSDGYIVSAPAGGYRTSLYPLRIFKVNLNGVLQWSKHFAISTETNYGFSSKANMILSQDDDIIITGGLYSEISNLYSYVQVSYLLKISGKDGNIIWMKKTGLKHPSGNSFIVSGLVGTSEGNYVVAGNTTKPNPNSSYRNGDYQPFLVRYNDNGDIISRNFYHTDGDYYSVFGTIINTSDQGFFISGSYFTHKRSPYIKDIAVFKMDMDGHIEWAKRIGKEEIRNQGYNESSTAVMTDTAEGSFVLGGSISVHKTINPYLLKFDKDGNKLWFNQISYLEHDKPIYFSDIYKTTDAGYLAVGSSAGHSGYHNDAIFDKVEHNGNSCRNQTLISELPSDIPHTEVENEIIQTDITSDVLVTDANIIRNPANYNITEACSSPIVLPLTLIEFTVQKSTHSNILNWNASNGVSAKKFEIQRSIDGKKFVTIGIVNTIALNKIENVYSFKDVKPFNGFNYYQLKITDKNGSIYFSEIKKINNNSGVEINAFPNIVKNDLVLTINSDNDFHGQLQILNIDGKVLLTQSVVVAQGNSSKTIPINTIASGYYFVRLISPGNIRVVKIMKE